MTGKLEQYTLQNIGTALTGLSGRCVLCGRLLTTNKIFIFETFLADSYEGEERWSLPVFRSYCTRQCMINQSVDILATDGDVE